MHTNITALKLVLLLEQSFRLRTGARSALKESTVPFLAFIAFNNLTILSLVRAFREAHYTLYCQALCALIPFFFANKNINFT